MLPILCLLYALFLCVPLGAFGKMVFNIKKGGGGEGEAKGRVHLSTLVPGREGVALQIGMPGPWRLGMEGVERGGVLPMPPLHLLGLAPRGEMVQWVSKTK